jgi:hypothetical protein
MTWRDGALNKRRRHKAKARRAEREFWQVMRRPATFPWWQAQPRQPWDTSAADALMLQLRRVYDSNTAEAK